MTIEIIEFPAELESFRVLAVKALGQWMAKGRVSFRRLKQGASGSGIVRVDVSPHGPARVDKGEYILKLSQPPKWSDQEPEDVCHRRAEQFNQTFAKDHVVALTVSQAFPSFADEDFHVAGVAGEDARERYVTGFAALYELAGGSLSRFSTLDRLAVDYLGEIGGQLSMELATGFSRSNPTRELSVLAMLQEWLGYRLDPIQGKELRSFISEHTGGTDTYVYANRNLLDPLAFVRFATYRIQDRLNVIDGLIHGDLHGGNILVNRSSPTTAFWLIDFALSKLGPIGFDHAYFEVGTLLRVVPDIAAVEYLELLDAIAQRSDVFKLASPHARQFANTIAQVRVGLDHWVEAHQKRRFDDVTRQLQLGRIAAGINWANKRGLEDSQRLAALAYASVAVDQFVHEFHGDAYKSLWDAAQNAKPKRDAESEFTKADLALWKQLVSAAGNFDAVANRYALVADPLDQSDFPEKVGVAPWSAVIDLDPYSDSKGLSHFLTPALERLRGVHPFDDEIPSLEPARSTAWMMAGGWAAHRKLFRDDNDWRLKGLRSVHAFCDHISRSSTPVPLTVFVVCSDSKQVYKIRKTMESLDEYTGGTARFIVVGDTSFEADVQNRIDVPIGVRQFFALLFQHTVGGLLSAEPEISSAGGSTPIAYEILRVIEENLTVLHSRILLSEDEVRSSASSPFWRGRPPTWRELDAGMDVTRSVHNELVASLRQKLEAHATETLILNHTPGSGGTTAARRAAWDLHTEFPTVVVRTVTRGLADRVRELHDMSQKPVLVVAELTVLSENGREDLYRALRRHNCRAVILYVRKTFHKNPPVGVTIANPMPERECEDFERAYLTLVDDDATKRRIRELASNEKFSRYRIPFFYGLTAFDRDFETIDSFVGAHLENVRGRVREAIEVLAFVTLFSDTSLPKSLIARILGLSPTTTAPIDALIGEAPTRLLVEHESGYRMMHQLIAEEVLNWAYSTTGDQWQLHLQQLALRFIEFVTAGELAKSDFAHQTLRAIFIDRVGGQMDDLHDRKKFSPIVQLLDQVGAAHGHAIFVKLTEVCEQHAHFWVHRARHHIYALHASAKAAESYLERAVQLAPTDAITHHAYGLVLGYKVRELIRKSRISDPTALVDLILPDYRKAADEFRTARSIEPENPHGYITHIQLNTTVCNAVKKTAKLRSIGELRLTPHVSLAPFVDECVGEAELPLRDVASLYGTLSASHTRYVALCTRELNILYGDYDQAIRGLERVDLGGAGDSRIRRSLANAYLGRRQRKWSGLSVAEVRRVVSLMERNLDGQGRQDDDYRLWFEGYRLLPDYDTVVALDRLTVWSIESTSWRPHYYLFILHFLRWWTKENGLGG